MCFPTTSFLECLSHLGYFALFVGYTAALVSAVQFYEERKAEGYIEKEMKYAAVLCGFRAIVNFVLFFLPSLKPREKSVKQIRREPPPEVLPFWQMFEILTDLCTVIISPFLICMPFALANRYKLGFLEVNTTVGYLYIVLSTVGVAYAVWQIIKSANQSFDEMDKETEAAGGGGKSDAKRPRGARRRTRTSSITYTSKQKDYAMCLNIPRLLLGAAALFLGYGVHQKYNDPFLLLGSLICICLGVLGGERESAQLHDFGLLIFLFTAFKADLDFRTEHVVLL